MMDRDTFDQVAAGLQADGYQPLPPTAQAGAIDGRIVKRSYCAECGARSLDYQPFSRANSYRAFVICRRCGHVEEF